MRALEDLVKKPEFLHSPEWRVGGIESELPTTSTTTSTIHNSVTILLNRPSEQRCPHREPSADRSEENQVAFLEPAFD